MRSFFLMMVLSCSLFAGQALTPLSSFGSMPVTRVALSGHTLYTVQERGPLAIYDVANPAEIRAVGLLHLTVPRLDQFSSRQVEEQYAVREATDVDVDGDRLYVALGRWGVNIYDLSDPYQPRFLQNHRMSASIRGVSADGDQVALEVSDPQSHGQVYVLDQSENLCHVATSRTGSSYFVTELNDGLLMTGRRIYDTARVDSYGTMDQVVDGQRWALGNRIGIRLDAPQQLFDLTSTYTPEHQYTFTTQYDRFTIFGNVVLAFLNNEMTVFDLNSRNQPSPRFTVQNAPPLDMDLSDGLLVSARGEDGFTVMDLNAQGETFSQPVILGTAHQITVSDGLAYVAHGDGGLRIVDVTTPGAPVLLGSLSLSGSVLAVAVADGVACLATSYGLELVDVTKPSQPTLLGDLPVNPESGGADKVLIIGNSAVVRSKGDDIVVDITDPAAPKIRAPLEPSSHSLTDAAILEQEARGRIHGLTPRAKSNDRAHPDHPVLLTETVQLGDSETVVQTEHARYVTSVSGGTGVLDVVDLTRNVPAVIHRERLGSVNLVDRRNTPDLVQVGDRLITGGSAYLWIFDITNPTAIERLDKIPFTGIVADLEVWEDRLFVVDGAAGMVYEYSLEAPPRLVIPWLVNNAGFSSKLILHNGSNLAQEVTLKAVSREGDTREQHVTIAAEGVFTARSQTLFPGLSGYSLTVHAQTQQLYGSFLISNREAVSGGNSPSQTTAASLDQLSAELVFGYVPGDQTAAVVLLAPHGRGETPVTLTLHDRVHGRVAETTVQLVDQRPTARLVGDLFPEIQIPPDATLTARVQQDQLIAGTTFVFNALRQPSMTAAFPVTPTNMTLVEETHSPRYRHLTEPREETVYAASGLFGIEVVALSDGEPRVVNRVTHGDDDILRVHLVGEDTLLALTSTGLVSYDLSQGAAAPLEQDRIFLENVDDLVVHGDWVYLAISRSLWVIDVRDPRQLTIRSISALDSTSPSDPRVAAANGRLYANHFNSATGLNYLSVYALTDPAYPQLIVTHQVEDRYKDMVASGDLVAFNGPVVWDMSQPESPVKVFEKDRDYRWLEFDGLVLWQDDDRFEISSFDFSAGLEDPVVTNEVLGPIYLGFSNARVVDGVLYGGGRGLSVFDTRENQKRRLVGLGEHGTPWDVKPEPAGASPQARAAKTDDPDLDLIRRFPVGFASTYWTHGDLTLVLRESLLMVFQSAADGEPCLVSTIDPGYIARDVIFHGDHAYVLRGSTLIGFDLSDPSHPRQTAWLQMREVTTDIKVAGHRLKTSVTSTRDLYYRMERSEHLIPWVVNNDAFTSRVALYHQGNLPAKVTLTATDREGQTQTTTVTVAPQGVLSLKSGDLFPGLTGYSLRLVSARPNLYVSFMTINQTPASGGNSPSQTTAAPVETLTSQVLFGSVPGDDIAALVLAAGEVQADPNRTCTVALQLHDETGVTAGTEVVLTGNRPTAVTAAALFGVLPDNAVIRAVALDGTPIAGTTFVFNTLGQPSMARSISLKPRP